MAVTADPLWINAQVAGVGPPSYTANEMRLAMGAGVMYDGRAPGGRKGVRHGGNQFLVSVVGTTITVKAGIAILDPALTSTQGSYWCCIPTDDTLTQNAPDATNPRKDIVYLRVYDNDEDGLGNRFVRSEYLAGTAAPSPVAPTLPASSIQLALLDVPASGGGSTVVTDTRPYSVAPGGILPVRATGDIAAGTAGRYRDRLDTNLLERDNGAAWVTAADPAVYTAWTSYTPTLSATGGGLSLGTAPTINCAYKQVGKTIYDRGFVSWGTSGSGGTSGFIEITWPVTPISLANSDGGLVGAAYVLHVATQGYPCIIRSNSTTARRIVITGGGTNNQLTTALPFAIGTSGDRITWNMTYEVP